METLERTGSDEGTPDEPPSLPARVVTRGAPRTTSDYLKIVGGVVGVVGLIYWAIVEEKIRGTLVTVVIAVGASAGLWIGANLLFNTVRSQWRLFNTIAFATAGALTGILLHGNHVTVGSGEGFLTWVLGPLVGAVAFGAVGLLLARTDDPGQRRIIALAGSAVIGVGIGALIRDAYQPGLDPVAIVVYTAVVAAIGAGISLLLKHPPLQGVLLGAAIGWVLGAWGGADLGDGSPVTSIVYCPGWVISSCRIERPS